MVKKRPVDQTGEPNLQGCSSGEVDAPTPLSSSEVNKLSQKRNCKGGKRAENYSSKEISDEAGSNLA